MMRVTFELLPGGDEDRAKHLGTIEISNMFMTTVRSDGSRGDYSVSIWKKKLGVPWRTLRIRNYPREAYHPWELVRRILNEALSG